MPAAARDASQTEPQKVAYLFGAGATQAGFPVTIFLAVVKTYYTFGAKSEGSD